LWCDLDETGNGQAFKLHGFSRSPTGILNIVLGSLNNSFRRLISLHIRLVASSGIITQFAIFLKPLPKKLHSGGAILCTDNASGPNAARRSRQTLQI
jgi:hypothetical protein